MNWLRPDMKRTCRLPSSPRSSPRPPSSRCSPTAPSCRRCSISRRRWRRRRRRPGVIPATRGRVRSRRPATPTLYDIAAIGKAAALAGNVAIPLVKALTAQGERARARLRALGRDQPGRDRHRIHALRATARWRRMRADLRAAMRSRSLALVGASRDDHGGAHADAAGAADHASPSRPRCGSPA